MDLIESGSPESRKARGWREFELWAAGRKAAFLGPGSSSPIVTAPAILSPAAGASAPPPPCGSAQRGAGPEASPAPCIRHLHQIPPPCPAQHAKTHLSQLKCSLVLNTIVRQGQPEKRAIQPQALENRESCKPRASQRPQSILPTAHTSAM